MRKLERGSWGLVAGFTLVVLAVASGPGPAKSVAQDAPEGQQPAQEHNFVGSRHCKKCHLQEYRSWEETAMAKAYQTLAPGEKAEAKTAAGLDPQKDYRQDPKCLVCHVVGYGKEGGFNLEYDAEKDRNGLLGVGCEMCHGAARDYLGRGNKDRGYAEDHDARKARLEAEAGYQPKPTEQTCRQCHNEHSPTFKSFDFKEREAKGVHEHPQQH